MTTDTNTVQAAMDYVQQQREAVLEGYKKLLSFPSIGADPAHDADVRACAEWIMGELQRIGFDNVQIMETAGHPVVYADWLHAGDDKPTVLVYDHYDVQPVDPLHLWESEPFGSDIREGKLYARGAVDNKAGVWGNIVAFEALLKANGGLPLNVKILFEGEEESGSPSIAPFVEANKQLLSADVMLNCDGGFHDETPHVSYAGRGIVAAEVKITGPKADLHSGMFGGVVQNPLHVAAQIIASFHDGEGRVTLPGYYDSVESADEPEAARIEAGWHDEQMREIAGVDFTWGQDVASTAQRATIYPTLDVNGMWGGYQGPGNKTIIPAEAGFKVTMRIVPDQDPDAVAQSFKRYVEGFASETIGVEVKLTEGGWPFALVTEGPYVEAMQSALEETVGVRANMERTGGSIPILGLFNRLFGLPIIGYGYGKGDGIHSPNEYVEIEPFFMAVETAIRMYHNLAEADA